MYKKALYQLHDVECQLRNKNVILQEQVKQYKLMVVGSL